MAVAKVTKDFREILQVETPDVLEVLKLTAGYISLFYVKDIKEDSTSDLDPYWCLTTMSNSLHCEAVTSE